LSSYFGISSWYFVQLIYYVTGISNTIVTANNQIPMYIFHLDKIISLQVITSGMWLEVLIIIFLR
jgi:hypothetical protein